MELQAMHATWDRAEGLQEGHPANHEPCVALSIVKPSIKLQVMHAT